ncbi:MAG TPA: imelysin family protein [Archangium sp.]|uniref:imelysin family protein n=1 Tax=Archangium sp. TaxID=1872627 RepID=UPI002E2F82F0|nr:imelysin family protein [Archangium sp.]HEX5746221.1 imelysin family protein [Archangium sp.]
MSPIFRRLIAPTLLLSLAVVSCGDSQGTALRSAFLKELAGDVALPAYRDLDTRTEALAGALAALEATPTETTLTQARTAWREARGAWLRQEAFRFGPAEEQHTSASVNQVPSTTGIDSLLVGDVELTETYVAEQGANRKGLLAMEYLLFDAGATEEGSAGARRRAYLKALGALLHEDATAVSTAWEPEQGNYVAQLSNAGNEGSPYATQKDAVDTVVNRLISSVEVTEQKLSKPLGFETGGTVRPELEEARRSDNSLEDLKNAVLSMERVWLGASGNGGLSKVVAASNKQVDATVRGDLAAVRSALEAIPPPLRTALTNDRESVEAARAALSTLRATLASEVVSNLGVTLKFNDNDGD